MLYGAWQLCYSHCMKPKYLIVVSVAIIGLLLAAVVGFVWWQNGFEEYPPISGNQVSVGLVPAEGTYLAARYYAAPGKVSNRGVILLHQYNSNQNAWNEFAAELQDRGFAVMTLDFPGHGTSSGDLATMTEDDYQKFATDAADAVEYLRDINADMKIAVIGAGLGANVGLQLAANDESIAAAVLVSPQYNYRGVKITTINKNFTRPIYYLVSRTDTISLEATQGLYDHTAASTKELRIAEEAKGRGTNLLRHAPKLRDAMVDWLELSL